MHYLHKILVHVPSAITVDEETSKEDIIQAVISHAAEQTESFGDGNVFDWRKDTSAGRWTNIYPQCGYLASDDPDWFIKELEEVQTWQKQRIDECVSYLREHVGTDLESIVDTVWHRKPDPETPYNWMIPYYLESLASLLHGRYQSDSNFYNTYDYTARVYDKDLAEVREHPENWALVMFDYHN